VDIEGNLKLYLNGFIFGKKCLAELYDRTNKKCSAICILPLKHTATYV